MKEKAGVAFECLIGYSKRSCIAMSLLRNVFAFEEEDPDWKDALAPFPNKVPRFATVKDCLEFFEK